MQYIDIALAVVWCNIVQATTHHLLRCYITYSDIVQVHCGAMNRTFACGVKAEQHAIYYTAVRVLLYTCVCTHCGLWQYHTQTMVLLIFPLKVVHSYYIWFTFMWYNRQVYINLCLA